MQSAEYQATIPVNQPIKITTRFSGSEWRHWTALTACRFRRCWDWENDSKQSHEFQAKSNEQKHVFFHSKLFSICPLFELALSYEKGATVLWLPTRAIDLSDFWLYSVRQKVWGGGGSRERVSHEVLSLKQGVGRAIFSYAKGVGHPILLHI